MLDGILGVAGTFIINLILGYIQILKPKETEVIQDDPHPIVFTDTHTVFSNLGL